MLYPLAIVLIFLTFAEPLFKERVDVYRWSLLLTGFVSIVDGIKAAGVPVTIYMNSWSISALI